MSCRPFFITLTRAEKIGLSNAIHHATLTHNLGKRRRLSAIYLSSEGKTVREIAQYLSVSEYSVWKWFYAYRDKGLSGLKGVRVFRSLTRKPPKKEDSEK